VNHFVTFQSVLPKLFLDRATRSNRWTDFYALGLKQLPHKKVLLRVRMMGDVIGEICPKSYLL